ncbi:MAG: MYXO-CTERM sorting domain-containing protein [Myxococcota bacterium]
MTRQLALAAATLGLITSLFAAPASAETVESKCRADWWTKSTAFSTGFDGLSASPTIPLPTVWSEHWTSGAPDPATTPELEVVVRDSASTEVAGTLGAGLDLGPAAAAYYGATSRRLERTLWWRPDADLAPGTYDVTITAGVPALSSDNAECYFQEFTATLSFTVAAQPPPAPTLTAKATLARVYSDTLVYQTGAQCAANPNATACADEPTVCCAWSEAPAVEFATQVEVTGLSTAKAFGHALFIERDALKSPTAYDHELVNPVADQSPLTRESRYRPAPFERPFPNGFFCLDATLRDLTTGVDVATVQECAFASGLDSVKLAPPACDPVACAAAADPAAPGPDPTPDAGPDASTEPTPDVAINSDADATPFDVTPASGKQSSGCGATPASNTLPSLALLLAALALARRRKVAAGVPPSVAISSTDGGPIPPGTP